MPGTMQLRAPTRCVGVVQVLLHDIKEAFEEDVISRG
jgi:hypothetical protein